MWILNILKRLFIGGHNWQKSRPFFFDSNRTTKSGMLRAKAGQEGPYEKMGPDKSIYQLKVLSKSAQKVYVYLSAIADKDGFCFPFYKTIASRTKLSESTVSKAIKDLEEIQLITHQKRASRRGASSNLYHVKRVAEIFSGAEESQSHETGP